MNAELFIIGSDGQHGVSRRGRWTAVPAAVLFALSVATCSVLPVQDKAARTTTFLLAGYPSAKRLALKSIRRTARFM